MCDAPPGRGGPHGGRLVEVEDENGRSLKIGEWVEGPDGLWALRVRREDLDKAK